MSLFVVWVDRGQAKLFQFSSEKMERRHLQSELDPSPLHSTEREHSFFSDLALHLVEAARILILGPGVARFEFLNHLIEHRPMLARRVVACEASHQPSDSEIASFAKKFLSGVYC